MKSVKFTLILFLFLASVSFSQTKYYISSNNGNDNNNGKSETQPLKTISKVNTLKLSPGDQILFKKGDIWENGEKLIIRSSGTSLNPIIYGAYGSGEKPILSLFSEIEGWNDKSKWVYVSDKLWKIEISGKLTSGNMHRLWLDNKQFKKAETVESSWNSQIEIARNTFGINEDYRFVSKNNQLFLYAPSNPATYYSKIITNINTNYSMVIDIEKSDHIIVRDLEIRGGKNGIIISGSDYVTVENCKVISASMRSVYVKSNNSNFSEYCNITDNIFDADWKDLTGQQYEYYSRPWSISSTFLTVNIGLELSDGSRKCTASKNKVYDFYFAGFRIMGLEYGSTDHEIFDNEIYCDNIPLGRIGHIVAYSGYDKIVWNNRFYNNYGRNTGLNFEIGGTNNYVYFNILDMGKNARPHVYYAGQGVGLSLESGNPNGQTNNNFVFNNTVYQIESEPLRVWGARHFIANNLVLASGNGINNIAVKNSNSANTISNNLIWFNKKNGLENIIVYDGKQQNISEFNNASTNNNDIIRDNLVYSDELQKIITDPANHDFSIQAGSPAINSGTDISHLVPEGFRDRNGTLVNRKSPQIGALGQSENSIDVKSGSNESELKVFLEGPFKENKMINFNNKQIPTSQPYNSSPWRYNGNEKFSKLIPNMVDWLLLELNSTTNNSNYRFAALLMDDGSIINYLGVNDFSIYNISDGSYYLAIYHRNHISIMSSEKIEISNSTIIYNFSNSQIKAQGSEPMKKLENGLFAMYAGDSDGNGVINNLDFANVANNIFSTEYAPGDLDMNGIINVLDYSKINANIFKKSSILR